MIEGVTMWPVLPIPIRIGPTSSPPATILMMFRTPLAASVLAKTSTFAGPSMRELGKMRALSVGSSAASECISPSYSKSSFWLSRMASAARVRRPELVSRLPNCECEQTAIFGTSPNRRTCRAAPITTSAISSAVGSGWTWVSATKTTPRSWIIKDSAPTGCSFSVPPPSTSWTYFRCQRYCPKVPQIRLSASPRRTITAPIAVVLVRMIARARSGVTPCRCMIE